MKNDDFADHHSKGAVGSLGKKPIDMKSALERAMGDLTFLEMMLQQFIDQMPAQMEELKAALDSADGKALQEKAHALRGSAANLSAIDLASTALYLEEIGRTGELEKGEETLDLLQKEVKRLGAFISRSGWNDRAYGR
jgi:HPt (histidine-containing phosphotransfer) domain-containing protein